MGFSSSLPSPNERPLTVRREGKVFWASQLEADMRFPIPLFFNMLAHLFRMPLNQLNPASVRNAVFLHMIMTLEWVEDIALLFFKCHQLKSMDSHFYFSHSVLFSDLYGHCFSLDKD